MQTVTLYILKKHETYVSVFLTFVDKIWNKMIDIYTVPS